jgi:hypothetical protein
MTAGVGDLLSDHDTTGSLATGEPVPEAGMKWRVLGIPSTGRRHERRWIFIGHARDEVSAIRLGREAIKSPEWTKWCHQRLTPRSSLEKRNSKKRRDVPDRAQDIAAANERLRVLSLVRRVYSLLGREEPSDLSSWPTQELERHFYAVDGNTVLSKCVRRRKRKPKRLGGGPGGR